MKVLLIDAIGLQTAYLGCYGNDWIMTPNLDRLSCEAVVFDRCYADRPSVRSPSPDWLRHGRYRIADAALAVELPDERLTFCEPRMVDFADETMDALQRREDGIVYSLWTGLIPPWDVPQSCLDDYFDDDSLAPILDPPIGPFPPDDGQSIRYTYSAAVTYFDEQLGMLFEALDENGATDNLQLWIMSQSGLALGEHGYIGEHRAWLHGEIVHMPLLCRLPNGQQAGRRIGSLVQPVDIAATLWAAVGHRSQQGHGFDLTPLMMGQVERVREYACSGLQIGESAEWALRTSDWAYLSPRQYPPDDAERRPQLYAKPEDQYEVNDLYQQQLDYADELESILGQFVDKTKQAGSFDAPKLPD